MLLGGLLALGGCWLLLGGGQGGFASQYLPGYLMALLCALIWSLYSVASRLVAQVPTDAVGWFCAATALLGGAVSSVWRNHGVDCTVDGLAGRAGPGAGAGGDCLLYLGYRHEAGQSAAAGRAVLRRAADFHAAAAGRRLATPSWSLLLSCLAIIGGAALAARAG
jgi:drug/metabolite transporter (DMT)-like permease